MSVQVIFNDLNVRLIS